MFQSLKANVAKLGFYAGRLRKEKVTKAVVLSTASLALVLQLGVGIVPQALESVSANHGGYQNYAPHAGDDAIVRGGVSSKAEMLQIYNNESRDIDEIFKHFGVTAQDIKNTTKGTFYTDSHGGDLNVLSRKNWPGHGRSAVKIDSNTTIYTGPWIDGANNKHIPQKALIGKRAVDGQWFAIILDCANLVYITPPEKPEPKPEKIKVCELDTYNIITINKKDFNPNKHSKNLEDCQKPEPKPPLYRCDSLDVTRINRTTVKFETNYTVERADFQDVTYVIRDSQGNEIERTTDETYEQTEAGDYSVQAIISVTVNGKTKTDSGAKCKEDFTIVEKKTPDVMIEKKVNGVEHTEVAVDESFDYQVTVTNTGETDLTNAVVTDEAPEGVIFTGAEQGEVTEASWTHTIPSLAVGESVTFTITAEVTDYQEGEIVNTACVDAPSVNGNPDDCDDASVEVPPKPETPAELPKTGVGQTVSAALGLGSMIAAVGYYVASRRGLLSAFLNQ